MLAEDAVVLRYGEVRGEIDALRDLGFCGRGADGRAARRD